MLVETIRNNIGSFEHQEAKPNKTTRQAAVAIIVREINSQLEMLFIKRAEKEGDPWSGHMAFPGGHREPDDQGLREAAERETLEEIGLDLSRGNYLGAIDHQSAQPRGRTLNMLIAPHVFEIFDVVEFSTNYEVDEVVWAPVEDLLSNKLHDTETLPMAGTPTIFNGYRLSGGHFVWGLTYRILKSFFEIIDPSWSGPREL